MPYYRQVEVEVLGEREVPLKEYGESRNDRMNMRSCFIQSETDKRFRIRISPDEELFRFDLPSDENEYDTDDEDIFGRSRSKRPVQPTHWHLLATLKLDGRPEIERRVFVLLDRNDPTFEEHVVLKGAMVRDPDGYWREYEWVFKDVGIDVSFENLVISGFQGVIPAQPDELADAFSAMSGTLAGDKYEGGKVGQIQVRLDRVTLGETIDGVSGSLKDAKDLSELEGSMIGDAQHMVGRRSGIRKAPPSQTTYYHYMDKGHQPYAIFRFNYCEEKKLRKLGFIEATPTSQTSGKRSEALKMAAAVQKKLKPPVTYKFRNMEGGETDDGNEGDDEESEDDEELEFEDEHKGPSEDLPLGDLGDKLGELGMNRTRKRDDEALDESEKKAKAE